MQSTPPLDGLKLLRAHAASRAALTRLRFPDAVDPQLEVQATTEFREAASLLTTVFPGGVSKLRLLEAPDGSAGGLMKWCVPDWGLVLYAAKLLRYIALCGQYEKRIFSADQRTNRDEREKRHAKLLAKWEVVE